MATIRPFQPIRPNPLYADQLVFTKPQAESVSGDYTVANGLKPLKTLLETGARQRPETPEGQALAYQDIRETWQTFLEQQRLWQEEAAGIYVYETVQSGQSQTGIWALTDLTDYTSGNIKIHELTFADSVRRIRNYREHTGLEGSPILLAYPLDDTINAITTIAKAGQPQVSLGNEHGLHRLWKIENPIHLQQLTAAFAKITKVYLADGHHRLEGAVQLAKEQTEKGLPAYQTISSLYMSADQLRIEPYDRVVVPEIPLDRAPLFDALGRDFYLSESGGNQPVHPTEHHRMGMYIKGQWYHLFARPHVYQGKRITERLGAVLLQELVLSPIFSIHDPKTDARLKCAGG